MPGDTWRRELSLNCARFSSKFYRKFVISMTKVGRARVDINQSNLICLTFSSEPQENSHGSSSSTSCTTSFSNASTDGPINSFRNRAIRCLTAIRRKIITHAHCSARCELRPSSSNIYKTKTEEKAGIKFTSRQLTCRVCSVINRLRDIV